MSLQVKFLLLVGTLLLTVLGSITAASWALGMVHREIATPFDQMSITLGELSKIKRQIESIGTALGNPPDESGEAAQGVRDVTTPLLPRMSSPEERTGLALAIGGIDRHVASLEGNEWYRSRIGVSTWTNIRRRLDVIKNGVQQWLAAGDAADRSATRRAAFELHELIEKTELRILDDSREAVGYSARIGSRLGWLLAAVALGAALVCSLGVILLRRWVQQPVAELRKAAARIAAGDFSHRVAVATGDEIGQLMSEVNHMAGMVDQYQREAIDRERLAAVGQMVRRIVHNVRNPLAGIRGLAEITKLETPPGSEHRENLELIVSTVDTFERWLTQLLETTRPMDLNPMRVALAPWAAEVIRSHESGARAKGVVIVLDSTMAPAEAEFDPRHLEQALAAVLANAIDTSKSGDSVFVRVQHVKEGDLIELSVCDQGSGVPPELRERIFEPHFTTKARGTGIGLAIARQILRSHGGSITLETSSNVDSPGTGACFRLRLPRISNRVSEAVAEYSHQAAEGDHDRSHRKDERGANTGGGR